MEMSRYSIKPNAGKGLSGFITNLNRSIQMRESYGFGREFAQITFLALRVMKLCENSTIMDGLERANTRRYK